MKRLILLTCFFAIAFTQISFAQSEVVKKSNQSIKSERKKLKKNFGIVLPKFVQSKQKFKLKKSGVTYLLIKMSKKDALEFMSATGNTRAPKGVLTAINDGECKRTKGLNCVTIGTVFVPSDEPEEVDQWQENNDFKSDVVASITLAKNGRLKSYASFFLDTEKGLLMLWYKV